MYYNQRVSVGKNDFMVDMIKQTEYPCGRIMTEHNNPDLDGKKVKHIVAGYWVISENS